MEKVLLIIGAGPGIAEATAKRFGREGYRIVLASRNLERLETRAQLLRSSDISVQVERVDAADADQVDALVRRIDADVVHYNAGVLHHDSAGALKMQPIAEQTVEDIVSDMKINVSSAIAAIRAAVPSMSSRRTGTILLTGGGLGLNPMADLLTLSVGKAGVRATVQALFEPLKTQGIHIATVTVATLVSPGSKESAEIAEAFWQLHAQPAEGWTWETTYT